MRLKRPPMLPLRATVRYWLSKVTSRKTSAALGTTPMKGSRWSISGSLTAGRVRRLELKRWEILNIAQTDNYSYFPSNLDDCKTVPLRNRVVEASKDIPAFVPYMPQEPAVLFSNEEVADVSRGAA